MPSAEGHDAYLTAEEMEIIAVHCNEQKLMAKGAQEKSDLIFLCAYLRLFGARVEVCGLECDSSERKRLGCRSITQPATHFPLYVMQVVSMYISSHQVPRSGRIQFGQQSVLK